MPRSNNRAQHIIEAVLSGFEYLGSRPALSNVIQIFYRHMTKWSINQPMKIGYLAKSLSEDSELKSLHINIKPGKHSNPHMLFTGATYDNASGNIDVFMNIGYIFENERRFLQHVGVLQSLLQHEYTHAEQFKRMPITASSRNPEVYMARGGHKPDQSFTDYRREFFADPELEGTERRVARSVSVGIPRSQQTASQWYHSTPEEIMAWAVTIGSLLGQIRKKELPPTSIPSLHLRAEIRTVITALGQESNSPALNRFKRNLFDYLTQHEGYSSSRAVQDITALFHEARGHI